MAVQTFPLPAYWMGETSGVLRHIVVAYLEGHALTPTQIRTMRAYFRTWAGNDGWRGGEELAALRASVDAIETQADIDGWLERADDLGMDPF